MVDSIGSFLSFAFAAIGLVGATEPTLTAAAIAVAAAVVTVALLTLALPTAPRTSRAHPHRSIDASTLLSQSDPDAAGHPRSRAPGLAA